MSRESENDVARSTVIVLGLLFLGLVAVGVVTVALPEIRSDAASTADAGAEEP